MATIKWEEGKSDVGGGLASSALSSLASAAGLDNDQTIVVEELTLTVPRTGSWGARLTVIGDASSHSDGRITIKDSDGNTDVWRCDVISAVAEGGKTHMIVTGAAWVVDKPSDAKSWVQGSPLSLVIADVLTSNTDATLSADSDVSFLATSVNNWQMVTSETFGDFMGRIASVGSNITYRIDQDGDVLFKEDQFDDGSSGGGNSLGSVVSALVGVGSGGNEKPVTDVGAMKRAEVIADGLDPNLLPGNSYMVKYNGNEFSIAIEMTVYTYNASKETTTIHSRNKYEEKRKRIDSRFQRLLYGRMWAGTVTLFSSATGANVIPDSDLIKGLGLTGVPVWAGLPATTQLLPGQRVAFTFLDGDPQQPVICMYEDGTGTTEVALATGLDYVALATLVNTALTTIQSTFNTHVHLTAVGPTGISTTPIGALASVSAALVKAT